jgi:hypothetical protein
MYERFRKVTPAPSCAISCDSSEKQESEVPSPRILKSTINKIYVRQQDMQLNNSLGACIGFDLKISYGPFDV